jgi:hypothetical protein
MLSRRLLLARLGGGSFNVTDLVYNVKSYGATGNGTTDDTAAIQAAITAASAGGIVWFPPGTYQIGSTITVTTPGTTLAGAGPIASTVRATAGLTAGHMIQIGNGSDTYADGRIEGLSLTSASAKTGGAAVFITKCQRVTVEAVFTTNQYDSVKILDSTVVRLIDLNLYNQARHGIWIDGATGNDFFLARVVADNTPSAAGQGIFISGGSALIAENCDFLHFTNGLLLQPTTGRASEWHFLTGMIFDSCSNDGIHIGGGDGDIYGVTFANCWSASNANQGVYVGAGAGDIEGIEFGDSKILSNGNNGFQLVSPATRITIADSTIVGNSQDSSAGYHGIRVEAGITHLTITGTQCYDGLGVTAMQGYGISFVSGATDYVIAQGNNLIGNVSGGIDNEAGVSGTHLSISGNLVP